MFTVTNWTIYIVWINTSYAVRYCSSGTVLARLDTGFTRASIQIVSINAGFTLSS